ncbi:MAG: DUF4388 domain-containing protein [Myxococcales bacterium]|nr:DUF4388 domain-containing protein [Myxococcales bacterium]
MLEVSLRKAGFTVTPAASVQDALDKLELHAPDLIISETTFTDGDGFELRRRVRATPDWAEIPFIFLTAEAAIENKIRGLELGVDDYLTKPIYIKEIVTRINILLQKRQRVRFEERKDGRTRFAGRVADMPVVDVIQTIEISRKSGVIQFVGERGRQAAIYFRDGKVIDAEAGALQGEDAVYRLLTWSEGEFEVVFRTVRRREVITTSSQGLLMEGMRRLDEWSRILEQLPPLTHRFDIDAAELSTRLGDVPDDNNRILRLIDGKRTLLEVLDASDFGDLECLQAVARLYFEELLIDVDHDAPKRRDTGKPMPLVEVDTPTPIEEVASGPHPMPLIETARVSDSSILSEEVAAEAAAQAAEAEHAAAAKAAAEEPVDDGQPGALLGGYRQSSLMLIDAAVAAAQAIEPGLFDEPAAGGGADVNVPDVNVPETIAEDEPSVPPRRTNRASAPPPPDLPPLASREDSGLRMIGSLGRDRAEASGELVPPGASSGSIPVPETQRELVTILPRRVTREMAAVQPPPELASSDTASPTPSAPVEPPAPRSSPPRLVSPGSGVVREDSGPGGLAIALIIVAALLAGIAVFLWVKKSRGHREVAGIDDAGQPVPFDAATLVAVGPDAATPEAAIPEAPLDAAVVEPIDATATEPIDAAVAAPIDAAESRPIDAAVPGAVDAGSAPTGDAGVDPTQQAKIMMQQAHEANQEGDFEKALALANSSLKLRRTARAYIVRAQALQRLDRIEDALESIDSAEEVAPDYASVFEARGSILWAAGRWDLARAAYERFLEIEPDSARANQIKRRLAEPH